eukprot:CAMPEP_0194519460 /NCGR_PEP_ID=MMETSP0253-20130528/53124_1 /TAXON_ID=2966 /ORGANISM="Noctiluca scintillans" /LENGTH=125 /DNA_ID=CAMNT_0039363601 /DNA_START=83 /DNA_END=460 /DNA_ORIENTATION=-
MPSPAELGDSATPVVLGGTCVALTPPLHEDLAEPGSACVLGDHHASSGPAIFGRVKHREHGEGVEVDSVHECAQSGEHEVWARDTKEMGRWQEVAKLDHWTLSLDGHVQGGGEYCFSHDARAVRL